MVRRLRVAISSTVAVDSVDDAEMHLISIKLAVKQTMTLQVKEIQN